jgi:hypothetical protein
MVSWSKVSDERLRDFSGSAQLFGGAAGERFHTHAGQHFVGGAQVLAGVRSAALAAQPLAVQQVGSGAVGGDRAFGEVVEGLAVVVFGAGDQGSRVRRHAQAPRGAAGVRALRQGFQC